MDDGMKPVQEMLREAARASDEEAAAQRTALVASQRALRAWEEKKSATRPFARAWLSRPVVALVIAVLAIGITLAALWRQPAGALSFVVVPAASSGASGEQGKVGAWIAPPPRGLLLRFSEGSEIVLRGGASARVTRADERGANLLLERGALDASVVHRDPNTGWSVHAGPFEIRVVGTRFDAAWEPSTGTLDVHVSEGRVIVVGPLLDEGRGVGADERLRVSLQSSRFEMTRTPSAYADATGTAAVQGSSEPAASVRTAPPGDPPASPSSTASAGAAGARNAEPKASAAPATKDTDWQALARAGRHRAAIDAAVALGFDSVVSSSPAADLLLLADSARFAGETGRARQALLAARGRGAKGNTAFLLGKLSADGAGSAGEAAQWLETYLAEAPSGGLAEQALGRLIEVRRRAGQMEAARAAAARYLEKYPNGGYASTARAVVEP